MNSRRFSLHSSLQGSGNSLGASVFLVVLSMVLCSFVVTSVFAAVPLAILLLTYGYQRGVALGGLALAFFLLLTVSGGGTLGVTILYIIIFLFALLIDQIIRRDLSPVSGIYIVGGSFILLIVLSFIAFTLLSDISFREYVNQAVTMFMTAVSKQQGEVLKSASSQEALYMKELMEKPELLTTQILRWLPSMTVVSSFFMAWLTMLLVLRNSIVWRRSVEYSYQIRDLITYRVPEFFVYPLILSLALALGSDVLGLGTMGESIAYSLMYILAIFYFFHGFGVYIEFLDFMKIYGVMRSILIVMTIMMANRMLILIGVFDLWVNFRKFLKKKNNEGDIS